MRAVEVLKTNYGVMRFLLLHPTHLTHVPRWIKQRSAATTDLRLPWWPYHAIDWVERELSHQKQLTNVFEYGGGGSTLWLQDKGCRVVTVEHSMAWYLELSKGGVKGTLLLREANQTGVIRSGVEPGFFDDYVAAIDDQAEESLYLVIVDGRARVECAIRSMPKIAPGGLLLLDDANRSRYASAVGALSGWERYDFVGLKPADPFPAHTSIWRRPS